MKSVILCWSFVKKNFVPILITMIMLAVSMFVLVTFYGQYRYTSYTRDVMLDSELDDGLYFMINSDGLDPDEEQIISQRIINGAREYKACGDILTIRRYYAFYGEEALFNGVLFDKKMRRSFKLRVSEGRWLSDDPEYTEVVVGGVTVSKYNIKVGDTLTFEDGITAKVVGIMDDVVIYPSFNSYNNNNLPSDSLFRSNDTVLFITEETIPEELLDGLYNYHADTNFYLLFDGESSESERSELVSYLESNGVIAPYAKIISDSDEKINEWLSDAMPLPLFLIIISTICIICISTVVIQRSMTDYSKYFLMGCSKKKCIALVASPTVLLFCLPGVLNLISILFCPHLFRAGKMLARVDYIIGADAAITVILYLAFLAAILCLMPVVFYRRYSPIALYRRNM